MKVSTLSIVVGTAACNAGCPFCVSKMTPPNGVLPKAQPIVWDRLFKTLLFAERMGVTTVILTGKGEPTLFPDQVTSYLKAGVGRRFPFVELQTNGLTLSFSKLLDWQAQGLTTVALSVVHYLPAVNKLVYYAHRPEAEYPPLEKS